MIHADADLRVPHSKAQEIHALVPDSKLFSVAGGGHVTAARDPVIFNRVLREFVEGAPRQRTWTRAMKRPRALFISSPIGLGHAQRDLAIARELRKLQPDLAIDWFTADPAARYLESAVARGLKHWSAVSGLQTAPCPGHRLRKSAALPSG